MRSGDTAQTRREPQQRRAMQTVDAVLQAVSRVIRRDGLDAITTNRIAEAAGVSIGSLYQYFPDKHAIFSALHKRHIEEVRRVISGAVDEYSGSLREFTRVLVEGLADLHIADPELHELISTEVSDSPIGFRSALRNTFERVTSSERTLFVLPNVIEALVHGIAQRPPLISPACAKQEAVQTVLTCIELRRSA
jgi:AcrR family transcriptional regulator